MKILIIALPADTTSEVTRAICKSAANIVGDNLDYNCVVIGEPVPAEGRNVRNMVYKVNMDSIIAEEKLAAQRYAEFEEIIENIVELCKSTSQPEFFHKFFEAVFTTKKIEQPILERLAAPLSQLEKNLVVLRGVEDVITAAKTALNAFM